MLLIKKNKKLHELLKKVLTKKKHFFPMNVLTKKIDLEKFL